MKLIAPIIAILLLTGCSEEKDVAYYKGNPAERGKRVAECDTYNDGSQECLNAKQAMLEAYAVPAKEDVAPANEAAPAK